MTAPARPWDLRLGRWQDVLADVGMVDAVITDPPYSARTHEGFRDLSSAEGIRDGGIDYSAIDPAAVSEFVHRWVPATRVWFVVFSDHIARTWWADALSDAGMYVFAPVVWVKPDAPPRYQGDGPASQSEYITIARHRLNERGGSRRGYYLGGMQRDHLRVGGKPEWLMRALVRDYTQPGDLVCDPCAGGGTTLLAANTEGRRSIGAEMDPETYAKARKRLEAGYTPTFDFGEEMAR